MPDSKQLRVLKALTAIVECINPTNEDPATGAAFDIDLRGAVWRGRSVFGQETAGKHFVSILEAPQPINGLAADDHHTTRSEQWRLLVQGFVPDDKENPTDPAYDLKAKVEMQLARIVKLNKQGDGEYPEDFLLNGLVSKLVIGQGVVRPPTKDISPTAFMYIPLTVEITTDVTNPYG